ncbi:MAG: geranylgeranylglycerol-phosphate geranylgeranyltransferase [Candidatus Hodarchaeota archaeon]
MDIIEILRPINDIMGSLTVIIGILNTRINISAYLVIINIILGVITYFFIAGSGMVINDIYDLEIDKINRPERPIPSGRITKQQAKIIFFTTYGIGVVLSIFHSIFFNIGFLNITLAVFFGFIGWVYAKWGKKSGFFGNIIVSISFSIGLVYGAILNNSSIPSYIYFFFLTSFFLLLSREIIKGCEDIEGDKEQNVKTLAIRIGVKKSTIIAMFFSLAAILFFILPYFTPIINPLLFLISMFFGLIDVGYAVILMLSSKLIKENFKKISLLLKIGAFLGLISFLLASIKIT